jgi:hypothetical protein
MAVTATVPILPGAAVPPGPLPGTGGESGSTTPWVAELEVVGSTGDRDTPRDVSRGRPIASREARMNLSAFHNLCRHVS